MRLRFTKMQGLGNDFVVVDALSEAISLSQAQLRLLGDRHFGVGCDQILVVEAPPDATVDFRYRIFNADGGEVEQCGNGARCFAHFVHDRGLTDKTEIDVLTTAGVIHPRLEADGRVTVDMGEPCLEPSDIPFEATGKAALYPIDAAGQELLVAVVSMGNPHLVLQVDDVDHAPVEELGPLLERHSRFPQRVNVGFMQVMGRDRIRLRVFDLLGRLVFESTTPTGNRFRWDLTDLGGDTVPNGLYFYLITATLDGRTIRSEVGRILVLR